VAGGDIELPAISPSAPFGKSSTAETASVFAATRANVPDNRTAPASAPSNPETFAVETFELDALELETLKLELFKLEAFKLKPAALGPIEIEPGTTGGRFPVTVAVTSSSAAFSFFSGFWATVRGVASALWSDLIESSRAGCDRSPNIDWNRPPNARSFLSELLDAAGKPVPSGIKAATKTSSSPAVHLPAVHLGGQRIFRVSVSG
jgi:hypothetical protein